MLLASLACGAHTHPAHADTGDPFPLQQLHETLRLQPAAGAEGRWLDLARANIGLDVMPGFQSIFDGKPLDGVRTDLYGAFVWQAASDTLPGERSTVGAGRINLRADALLFRTEGSGMGRVTAQIRVNGVWPDLSDSMQGSTGAISDLDELASSNATALSRFMYSQSLFDDRAMLSAGKISANDFVLANVFANDESRQFLAQPFDGNSVWPISFQNHALGLGLVSLPTDWCFLNGFVVDAASSETPWLGDAFGEGFAASAEFGLLAEVDGLPARLSFAWCGTDANSDTLANLAPRDGLWGNAYGALAQVLVAPKLALWAQWSACDENVSSDATAEYALGTTIDDCFGRKGDGCGAAIAWSEPADGALDDQILLECYYRLQVMKDLQITLDGQVLMPSANPGVDDPTVVGSLRAVWRF
jgi:hypothetical protein